MKTIELKTALKDISRTIDGCSDLDELTAYLTQTEIVEQIEQAKIDLPGFWFGTGDYNGLNGEIEARKAELRDAEIMTERAR